MNCKVCSRDAVGKYCQFHEKAYKKVVGMYDVWKDALGISWEEYLKELMKNAYTGSWAKEVAEQILNEKK
jgi:hypothetical protein